MTRDAGSEIILIDMEDKRRKTRPSFMQRQAVGNLVIIAGCVALLSGFMTLDGGPTYATPPDFSAMPVDQKKREFFAYLSPMVESINASLRSERDRVVSIREDYAAGAEPGWLDRRWLRQLAQRYEVDLEYMELDEALAMLERRAGVVPESLALAQAAIESGWGTSRFALEGYNYFGQRCYEQDCGIAPQGRADARFGLAEFDSVADSVYSYIMNLNTHPEYVDFRLRRQALRSEGQVDSGLSLLEGLEGYSERGSDYLDEVRALIRANDLE